MARQVAVIIGSLRKESLNRKMAHALIERTPPALELKIVEIRALPLYNQDDEGAPDAATVAFRDAIRPMEAVLFVTPEYNRGTPGVLKNAIDVGSRPYGHSVWSGKPCAIVSVSPGATGGFGSNHQLRQSLVFLDMPAMQQPEAYIGHADKLFDADGKLNNPDTGKFLEKIMQSFAAWIERIAKS
ncbi:MAG TPA: NAD(P)H-dependent oxidoreductase [Xanthomonadaceae bacterium]|jgi:chromate reductase|nr:NAD(P)H-dependent oxidoreductase [Xanthomonadaceae bacterium]